MFVIVSEDIPDELHLYLITTVYLFGFIPILRFKKELRREWDDN
jgi:hypothetical protein